LVIGTVFGVIFLPKEFFFPAAMAYVLYGLVATVFIGLLDRLPGNGADDGLDDDVAHDGPIPSGAALATGDEVRDGERDEARDEGRGDARRRRRRRRPRGGRPGAPPSGPDAPSTAPTTPPTTED
ncbi:MAG TPA: hypothetical protein VFV33_14720, partial [Gemmatimonadaceae bacterium]|nr:hypothetical protein [Gemmatimonadaceae bacterium]